MKWRYRLYGNLWLIRKILSGGVLRGVGVVVKEANSVEGPNELSCPSVEVLIDCVVVV
jgi:hypothetical protein